MQPRGFTLFIAMLLTAVILSVGTALLDMSLKQVLLSTTAKNSSLAFYNADGAMECALYWDSRGTFDYLAEPSSGGTIQGCEGQANIPFTAPIPSAGQPRITTFVIPCGDGIAGDGTATTTIYKSANGSTSLYTSGYDSCLMSDPRRTERGLKASY